MNIRGYWYSTWSLSSISYSKIINHCLPFYNNNYSMDILGELSGISNLLTWSFSPVFHSKIIDLCFPFYNNNYSMDILGALSGISNLLTWSFSFPPVFQSKINNLCLPFYNNNYSMDILGELSGISNLLTRSLSPPSFPIQKLINPLNLSDNGVGFDSFPDKGRTPHFHTNIKEDFCSPVLQKLMRSQQRGLMSLY